MSKVLIRGDKPLNGTVDVSPTPPTIRTNVLLVISMLMPSSEATRLAYGEPRAFHVCVYG